MTPDLANVDEADPETTAESIAAAIRGAVEEGGHSHRELDPEFDALAALTVNLIRMNDAERLGKLSATVQALRACCKLRAQTEPQAIGEGAASVAGGEGGPIGDHLGAFARILGQAIRWTRPDGPQAQVMNETARRILGALIGGNPLSGRELADALDVAEETVARHLPVLRDGGLVRSWRAGRKVMNAAAPGGTSALSAFQMEAQAEVRHLAAPAPRPGYAELHVVERRDVRSMTINSYFATALKAHGRVRTTATNPTDFHDRQAGVWRGAIDRSGVTLAQAGAGFRMPNPRPPAIGANTRYAS